MPPKLRKCTFLFPVNAMQPAAVPKRSIADRFERQILARPDQALDVAVSCRDLDNEVAAGVCHALSDEATQLTNQAGQSRHDQAAAAGKRATRNEATAHVASMDSGCDSLSCAKAETRGGFEDNAAPQGPGCGAAAATRP